MNNCVHELAALPRRYLKKAFSKTHTHTHTLKCASQTCCSTSQVFAKGAAGAGCDKSGGRHSAKSVH